jgi:sulfotransferase family protein
MPRMAGRLPNFLIVGAMKSGTSSLASWIGAHPQAFIAAGKEIHFFDVDQNWELGLEWYRENFDGTDGALAVGEGTPRYMFLRRSVERMAAAVPEAKLIVCLRDPVERAFSHYLHAYYRVGDERRSFANAVADELAESAAFEPEEVAGGYVQRGYYARQLERLTAHFPRDRVHVVLFDDIRHDPRRVFADTCRFLGLADDFQPRNVGSRANGAAVYRPLTVWRWMRRHHVLSRLPPRLASVIERAMKRSLSRYPAIDPPVHAALAERFALHNDALAGWLGRDLPPWGTPRRFNR